MRPLNWKVKQCYMNISDLYQLSDMMSLSYWNINFFSILVIQLGINIHGNQSVDLVRFTEFALHK